ncbi:hypothetical protein AOP6_0782 [Desulfuromonas sp. AOP6]|nr:hypothetical protein AOP6_0782 [Desulfuromonas sp. AOP6]
MPQLFFPSISFSPFSTFIIFLANDMPFATLGKFLAYQKNWPNVAKSSMFATLYLAKQQQTADSFPV